MHEARALLGGASPLLDEQSKVQDQIDAANAWELDRTLEIAMDALRCPPPDADVRLGVEEPAPETESERERRVASRSRRKR